MPLDQVTVFGASGFVGRAVVERLGRTGARIIAAARHAEASRVLAALSAEADVVPADCDVTDPDRVAFLLDGSDAAVNLVGILHESPGRAFQALHADAPGVIAAAAAAAGVARFVHVSAIGADVTSPSKYLSSKGRGEAAAWAAFPDTTVLRPSVIFGPNDSFFNRFDAMARLSPALPLFGGGANLFQPVYVGDVAEAVFAALTGDGTQGRAFELGGPDVASFRDLMETLLEQSGRRRLLLPLPMVLADLIGLAGDGLAALGLTPPLTRDQTRMLRTDNVVGEGADGLEALGIEPTPMGAILPAYLGRGGGAD
ncbi:MAG: complex I NDUFA9 subunit family protein [Alphaproteobacteria bacterium]|nr:complex I NDUFA9 subunit family protein [Alphaproteobacteria bacterium]